MTTDPDELVRVIDKATDNFVEFSVARALADNTLRSIRWLQSFGTTFVPMEPTDGWKDYTLAPLGFHNKTVMTWEGLGADRLIDRLEQRIEELGGESQRGVKVTGLMVEDGAVSGVRGQTPDGPKYTARKPWCWRTAASRATRTCFAATLPRIRKTSRCGPRNPATATVCGWLRLRGPMLIGMEAFYGHVLSADSLHREGLSPLPFPGISRRHRNDGGFQGRALCR